MVELSELQELDIESLREKVGYVYVLLYKGVVVYIGKTLNLSGRIQQHSQSKLFDKCLFLKCQEVELWKKEKEFILHYKPIYNWNWAEGSPPFKVIDNFMFIRDGQRAVEINGRELKLSGFDRGFYNVKEACVIFDAYREVKYNFNTGEFRERKLPQDPERKFDFEEFEFVDERKFSEV